MASVLLTALSFVLLILFGFLLKRAGFFGPRDYQLMAKLVMNLTLPAAVIRNLAALELTPSLLFLAVLGLLLNVLCAAAGWLYTRRQAPAQQAFAMLSWSGYNIGAFAMPYLQGFLGAAAVGAACIFDVGNAIMCNGVTYAVAPRQGGERLSPGAVAKRLFSSPSFDVYLGMLILGMLHISVPAVVVELLAPAAAANSCMAMLMIGLMLELRLRPGYLRRGITTVLARNLMAAAGALLFYFCTPFPLEIRQVMAVVLFAPISVASVAFSEKCGCDTGLTGFTASLSILVSLGAMTLLILLLGVR